MISNIAQITFFVFFSQKWSKYIKLHIVAFGPGLGANRLENIVFFITGYYPVEVKQI